MGATQDAIIRAMTSRKMSQAELSRQSGVSKSSLSRYLNGDDIPASKLGAIAKALGVSVDDMMGIRNAAYLNPSEHNLIALFRSMDAVGREHLLENAAFLAERHPLNQADIA